MHPKGGAAQDKPAHRDHRQGDDYQPGHWAEVVIADPLEADIGVDHRGAVGQQIGGERDKQADQDLDGWLLAGAPNQKVITFAGDPHHHEATEDAPEGHQEKFHHRVSRGEAAGQHRGDGEIKGDEP